jgi:hypothetical protein
VTRILKSALILTLFLSLFTGIQPGICRAENPVDQSGPFRTGQAWNIEIEGGWLSERSSHYSDFRLQLGSLWVHEPQFFGLGVFGEEAPGLGAGAGIMASYSDAVIGEWVQAAPLWDQYGRGGYLFAAGFSLFGIEVERRFQSASLPQTDWLFELKLRVPLGIILFEMRR